MTAKPALIDKLNTLAAARLAEVEDFVELLRQRDLDRSLTNAARHASAPAFAAVWNNPEDDAYDAL